MPDWESFYRSLREPDFVPGYVIGERLGGGAFGEVHQAVKRSISKPYAIKFLRVGGVGDERWLERELEHVSLLAAIDHPNLVAIEDVGQVCGVPYVVMGYAGRETLARRLEHGDLDAERAFDYFVQVCRGVGVLHDRGLVHFDLKPSNVFLQGELARVGDYGLAKLVVGEQRTLSFGRGTPRYMAPEVLAGRADQRADVYSLGVLLYEVFAGRLPFEAERVAAALLSNEALEPEFPEAFPDGLRSIVRRCLALDPEQRPRSAGALLEALGQSARPGEVRGFGFDPALRVGRAPGGAIAEGPVDDVIEWETLERAPAPDPEQPGIEAAPEPEPRRFEVTEPQSPPEGEAQRRFATGAARRADRALAGVPVPPRFEGTRVEALGAIAALGLEMFLALLHGPLRAGSGWGGFELDSVFVGLGGLVRWILLCLVAGAALGGLLVLLVAA